MVPGWCRDVGYFAGMVPGWYRDEGRDVPGCKRTLLSITHSILKIHTPLIDRSPETIGLYAIAQTHLYESYVFAQ
jgi:hypothetical protein